jgi:hypothetical protein
MCPSIIIISRNLLARGIKSTSNGIACDITVSLKACVSIGASGRWAIRKDHKRSARLMYNDWFARDMPGHVLSKTVEFHWSVVRETYNDKAHRLPKPYVKNFIMFMSSLMQPSTSSQRWGSNFSGSGKTMRSRATALKKNKRRISWRKT